MSVRCVFKTAYGELVNEDTSSSEDEPLLGDDDLDENPLMQKVIMQITSQSVQK